MKKIVKKMCFSFLILFLTLSIAMPGSALECKRNITLSQSEITIAIGEVFDLSAIVQPSRSDKKLLVKSSSESIASVSTKVINSGDAFSIEGIAEGSTEIVVSTLNQVCSNICKVNVFIPVQGVSIEPESTEMLIGEKLQLTAKIIPENATNQKVTWSTSDPTVAIVEDGQVTAVGIGNVVINVKTDDGGFEDSCIFKIIDNVTTWQKIFGGCFFDYAKSIVQTSDGGYIVAGSSESEDIPGVSNHGYSDYYIVKLDAAGEIQWHKMFGGSYYDYVSSIVQTSDGGYIVAGSSKSEDIPGVSNHGYYDCYIIKLDAEGEIQWHKMFGGSASDHAISIVQTNDGGYIFAGDIGYIFIDEYNLSTDYYIIKSDNNGNVNDIE